MKYLAALLFFSSFAHAQEPCLDFPVLTGHGGPRLAATGMPFTNFMRFSCALGERFSLTGIEGSYDLGETKISASSLSGFKMPSGEILYQALFSVTDQTPAGVYQFRGCAQLRDQATGFEFCLPLKDRQVEIVAVPK